MPTYTPHVKSLVFEYNTETMGYHVEVPFDLVVGVGESLTGYNNILAMAQVTPDRTKQLILVGSPVTGYPVLPGYLFLSVAGHNCSGGTWEQQVICFSGARRFEEIGSTGTRKVIVTYEGRVQGIHSISSRVQMATAPIYQSIRAKNWDDTKDCAHQATPDGYKGIGTDFSGTTRDIPIFIVSVLECVPMGYLGADSINSSPSFQSRVSDWNRLAGSVNEQGWVPPWEVGVGMAASGGGLVEGSYLYLGATEAQVDKRTQTVMVRHDFAVYSARANQAVYLFQGWTTEVDPSGLLTRSYDTTYSAAHIQPVAGSDAAIIGQILSEGTLSAGTPITKWGDVTHGFNAYGNFGAPMIEG